MGAFTTVVRERRSIRRYLPERIPEALIREVISDACWAPSWGNTQSASVYVLSGVALEKLKAELLERALKEVPGEPDFEMPAPGSWPEPYRSRTGHFVQARTTFVAQEERKRGALPADPGIPSPVAGAALFGAPHLLLICSVKGLSVAYACFDAGAFAQTVALAAQDRGLGTCIMAGVVRHPDLFRALIPDSDDLAFSVAMTLGFPDPEAPINQFPRQRTELSERAFFVE